MPDPQPIAIDTTQYGMGNIFEDIPNNPFGGQFRTQGLPNLSAAVPQGPYSPPSAFAPFTQQGLANQVQSPFAQQPPSQPIVNQNAPPPLAGATPVQNPFGVNPDTVRANLMAQGNAIQQQQGATGQRNNTQTTGGGTPTSTSPNARDFSNDPYMRASVARLDPVLGQGWSQQFKDRMGIDPISFYAKAFPHLAGDPARQFEAAANAAENDARYQPAEIADWQQKHGNTPIPPEQWKRWWYLNQNGGGYQGGGEGVDPYAVH